MEDNYIAALVEPDLWDNFLEGKDLASIPCSRPLDLPSNSLECIYGQHRILAAKEIFVENEDRWWMVKLFKRVKDQGK